MSILRMSIALTAEVMSTGFVHVFKSLHSVSALNTWMDKSDTVRIYWVYCYRSVVSVVINYHKQWNNFKSRTIIGSVYIQYKLMNFVLWLPLVHESYKNVYMYCKGTLYRTQGISWWQTTRSSHNLHITSLDTRPPRHLVNKANDCKSRLI